MVILSVGLINEVLERRQRKRWSVLAQYVMFELVRNARMIWSGLLDAAGMFPNNLSHAAAIARDPRPTRVKGPTPRCVAAFEK